jgi:hypothetical protein
MDVKWKTVNVKEGNREMNVLVPDMGDRIETNDLIQAETEKTHAQLKANQRPVSTVKPEDRKEALKEFQERRERKRDGTKKYY